MRRIRLVVGLTAVSIGLAFASDRVGDEAGKPDSDSPSATHEIRRDTNAEVPAPREAAGRRRASDSPGTAITFPFVRADERHTTLVVTINGTYDPLDVAYVGCEGRLGFSRQQADGSLVGKGSERVYLEQLFSHPERIDFLKVKAHADVYGKFNLEQFVRDHDGRTASGFAFNSTQSPMHHLSMTYTPDDASWRRITLINAGDVAVDVYWRDSTGEERVLAPNLGLGRQLEYDLPGFDAVPSADFYAKRAFTDTPVDALIGTVEFGYDDDYGRSAGYVMRGSDVTGEKNNFASEFYLPVWRIDMMELFQRTTSGWESVAYKNPTNRRQRIGYIYRTTEGDMAISTKFFAEPGEEVLRTLDSLGLGSIGGGVVTFTVTDAVTGQPSLGDMTYMIGDLPDDIMGSSVLGADTVPTVHDKSKYLSGSVIFTPQKSSLLYLMNPNDTPAFVDIVLFNSEGIGIAHNLSSGITLEPRGSYFVDTRSMLPSYSSVDNLKIFADAGVLGTVINYDNLVPVKDMQNIAAVTLQPTNEPRSAFDLEFVQLNGVQNPEEFLAPINELSSFIVAYMTIAADNGIKRAEYYIDGDKVGENIFEVARFRNSGSFNVTFTEPGKKMLEILLFADDDNEIRDFSRKIPINVVQSVNSAIFKYYDKDHNPTTTLKVNEPFYLGYEVQRNDGSDIRQMRLIVTPQNGTTDDKMVYNLSGTSVQGEIYVAEGIRINAQDGISDQVVTPEVNIWDSDNYTDNFDTINSEYNLPAERVYDDIPNYRQRTEDNLEAIAEILSREGVLVGGVTQLDYSQVESGIFSILNDGPFTGIEVNDYQNRMYFLPYESGNWFDMGGQTFFAEQNVDDLKEIYQVP